VYEGLRVQEGGDGESEFPFIRVDMGFLNHNNYHRIQSNCRLLPLNAPGRLALPERHNLDANAVSLEHIRNLLLSLPQRDLLPVILDLIKPASPAPKEPLQHLLRHLLLTHNPALHTRLKRIQYISQRMWLRKHAGRNLVLAALLPARMRRRVGPEEKAALALHDGAQQRIAVLGRLGHGLAEAERVAGPVVDDETQVVRRDGADDRRPAGAHGGEGRGSAAVLEDDAQVGEARVQRLEGWQEGGLGVQDGDGWVGGRGRGGRGRRRGDFAVEIQDHVLALHFGKDRVEGLVVQDA
jgi:hypothetical protein